MSSEESKPQITIPPGNDWRNYDGGESIYPTNHSLEECEHKHPRYSCSLCRAKRAGAEPPSLKTILENAKQEVDAWPDTMKTQESYPNSGMSGYVRAKAPEPVRGAEPPLTPWPKPTESQRKGGWKINLDFLKAIAEEVQGSDWETIEVILLAAAGKQESPLPLRRSVEDLANDIIVRLPAHKLWKRYTGEFRQVIERELRRGVESPSAMQYYPLSSSPDVQAIIKEIVAIGKPEYIECDDIGAKTAGWEVKKRPDLAQWKSICAKASRIKAKASPQGEKS